MSTLPVPPMSMIYIYGQQRKLGPRFASYQATIQLCLRMFPNLPMNHDLTLYTEDLKICKGQLTEIYHEVWEGVVDSITELVVMSKEKTGQNVGIRADGSMQVFVRTLTNKTIMVDVESHDTVESVKERLSVMDNTPVKDIRLIFEGKQLADSRTLEEYNIRKGSTIYLVLPLRGGKPIIYLLSPEPIEASIELSLIPQWSLSAIYPVVPIKCDFQSFEKVTWNVHVHPNGNLTESSTGLETAYLFWEALTNSPLLSSPPATPRLGHIIEQGVKAFDPSSPVIDDKTAVVICVEKVTPYLDAALKAFGLHTEARSSFITYWLPALLKHTYVALRFLPQASYEQAAMLHVSPIPDVVTRIFMVFQGVKEADLEAWSIAQARAEQDVSYWIDVVGVDVERTLDKTLFRVIEWGGMEVSRN